MKKIKKNGKRSFFYPNRNIKKRINKSELTAKININESPLKNMEAQNRSWLTVKEQITLQLKQGKVRNPFALLVGENKWPNED